MTVVPFKSNRKPKLGDKRIIQKFLFLPKFIGQDARWFGAEFIVQVYVMRFVPYYIFPGGFYKRGWVDKAWAV